MITIIEQIYKEVIREAKRNQFNYLKDLDKEVLEELYYMVFQQEYTEGSYGKKLLDEINDLLMKE